VQKKNHQPEIIWLKKKVTAIGFSAFSDAK
jgi:hypothetical protein